MCRAWLLVLPRAAVAASALELRIPSVAVPAVLAVGRDTIEKRKSYIGRVQDTAVPPPGRVHWLVGRSGQTRGSAGRVDRP